MGSRYPTWTSRFGAKPDGSAAAEWAETLSGITESQLKAGFDGDRARGSDWPPSSTLFRAMCLSIPTIHTIRAELTDKDAQRSRFGLLVWRALDQYQYKLATATDSNRMLREAYDYAKEHVMRGGALPELPIAFLSDEKEKRSKERTAAGAEAIARTAEILNQNPPDLTPGADTKPCQP